MMRLLFPLRHAPPAGFIAGAALVVVCSAASLHAQTTAPASAATTLSQADPRPSVAATLRREPISIDGRLTEAAWSAATPITDLHQQTPDEGKPPTERTEIRILFDANAIYVGARMYDTAGSGGVRKLLVRRDQLLNDNGSDKIALVLDPYHDRQTRVWFELNPLGVKGDHLNGDASFDPVWEGAANVDSLGWTAEFRIPLSQLRFPRDSVQTWGFQIWRTIARRNEYDMWAFWRNNESGGPGYFGTITGLALAQQPRQLELLPYVVTKSRFALPPVGDPFRNKQEMTSRVGGDLKYNITSAFTLDATVNPDFGQVEVDPAVVNLSDFETTFQEKRPFFVANASAFSFGGLNCFFCSNVSSLNVFYSRRIGRAPQLGGYLRNNSDFSDVPDASTILGAAKITGRTTNGLQVAMLEALTNHVTARYIPSADTRTLEREIEPRTNYFVGRVRQDLRQGDTRVGMITTLTNRFMSDSVEKSRLRANAQLVGADVLHYWNKRGYSFWGQLAVSNVAGDTAALRRTQMASAHYFQRPDRKATSDGLFDIRYDPNRTSLKGYGFYGRLAKESGDWLWETAQNWRSPGFEVNDIAALGRTDYKWMQASVLRQWTRPGKWYRDAAAIVGGQQQLNYDGDRTDLQGELWGRVTFPNYISVSGFVIHHPPTYDQLRTRGGVIVRNSGFNLYSMNLNGDSRQRVSWDGGAELGKDITDDGWQADGYADLIIKPRENIRLSFGPSFSRQIEPKQFVTNIDDASLTRFGGLRSVFAALDQRTFSMNTRLNATFSPTLTLELFAQPFLASGHYTNLKEYAAPRTSDVLVYGRNVGGDIGTLTVERDPVTGRVTQYRIEPDSVGPTSNGPGLPFTVGNPDFNVRSLRGTAVLRWEYRPGSTLFFVWTQERSGSDAFGDFDFRRDRSALFRDRPINVFQIKASYWLGL
ncbi:MAG: carbohydrate binding family 9 domain-containing protein [Gemmatimonadaceae bacterium]|nr:carbohydrate binding family 9 domain-containing protein [Gemmatimonadaceae bacterium]